MQKLDKPAHICNSQAYRDGYDLIIWDKGEYADGQEKEEEKREGRGCCGTCQCPEGSK